MGKPTRSNVRGTYTEYIGIRGDTGGTETSKYPEEKKRNLIPLVAVSEKGRAQTDLM
jgi:hypothetical protein